MLHVHVFGHILDFFNGVLEYGCVPNRWTEGIIVPIFKTGNDNDVNNVRGITLISCFSKLFTIVIYRRLGTWAEKVL